MGTRMAGSRSGSVWGVIPKRSEESLLCRCTFVKPGSCRLRLAMTILTTHSPSTSARHASGSRRLTSRRSTFWRSLLGALGCPIGECWYAFARRIRAFRSAGDGQQNKISKFFKALRSNIRSCAQACGSKERGAFLNCVTQAKACLARLKSCPDTRLPPK